MGNSNEKRPRRVGVFGGSFDPIHNAHVDIGDAILRERRLDAILFVPASQPPHKREPPEAAGKHRLAMVRLAIRGHPAFSVSDCELRRPGPSFTVDTMRDMRRELGREAELFFIIGSDSVRELPTWRNLAELAGLCTFIVAARPGWPLGALDGLAGHVPADKIATMKELAVQSTASPVSSTEVRRRVASGAQIGDLVAPAVAAYIAENKLYTSHQ